MVITAPSVPVISEMLETRRLPSVPRVSWTMISSERAMVWRTSVSDMFTPLIPTMASMRDMASRGRVGVDGGHRALVAGVHGLQHVQHLGGADLADDDAVGAHTQGVAHQIAGHDLAPPLDVGRPGLQAHHVLLLQLQLGGVLDGDDALARRG